MAKTDVEADISEHNSENEDAEQEQTEAGSSKLTLEQRQQKLARLRSRMVRQKRYFLTFCIAYTKTPAFLCPSEQSVSG